MIRKTFAALAASTMLAATPAQAIDPTFTSPSDLILGIGGEAFSSNLEVNLGAAIDFKNASTNDTRLYLGNIGTELTNLFGAGWHDFEGANALRFSVAGASNTNNVTAGTANANGDFNSTVYASRARVSFLQQSSPFGPFTGSAVTNAAASIVGQANTFSISHGSGVAVIANSTASDWSDFNLGTSTNQSYSIFSGTNGTSYVMGLGHFDDIQFYPGNIEGVVDLYRFARFSNGGYTPGTASFLGSIALSTNGDLEFWGPGGFGPLTPYPYLPEPGTGLIGLIVAGMIASRRRRWAVGA